MATKAKKLKEIKIDGVSLNVTHWSGKTLAEFTTEANKENAEMTPKGLSPADKTAWLKMAHDLIKKAEAGDESVKPVIDSEAEAEAAEKAETKKPKGAAPTS